MSVVFRCPSCGLEHPSRVWGPSQQWVEIFLESCGEVLEPCPATGEWVRLAAGGPSWVPSYAGNGIAAPLMTRRAATPVEPPPLPA